MADPQRETLRALCQRYGLADTAGMFEMHPRYLQWVLDGVLPPGPRLRAQLLAPLERVELVV